MIQHDIAGTSSYQKAWEYCTKCKVMFHNEDPGKGHCAAGAAHEYDPNAYHFLLAHDLPSKHIDD